MAKKIKVVVELPTIKRIQKEIDSVKNKRSIGLYLVDQLKSFITKGISPVKGEGKFEPYSGTKQAIANKKAKKIVAKSSRASSKAKVSSNTSANRKYPFNVMKKYPNKKASPVNLTLTGDMLKALKHEANSKGVSVGIFDQEMKERGLKHQYGDPKKFLPKRRFIPIYKEGDEILVSIKRGLIDLYTDILDGILKKGK